MKIAVGADEKTGLTDAIVEILKEAGHKVLLSGPIAGESAYWSRVAREVAEQVANNEAEQGVLLCWTGTGVSIAANKVPGIRAALCDDSETARGARLWNDANVLCMSLRRTSEVVAKEIIETWFRTEYEPNQEDDACIEEVRAIERAYSKENSNPS